MILRVLLMFTGGLSTGLSAYAYTHGTPLLGTAFLLVALAFYWETYRSE